MLKTIVSNPKTPFQICPNRTYELLDNALIEYLSPFFLTACSHKKVVDILPAHTIQFYIPITTPYKPIDNIWLTTTQSIKDGIFFDWDGSLIENSRGEPAIILHINNRFAGLWFPRLRSLAATDWTHDVEGVNAIKDFFPQLVAALNLKPFTKATYATAVKRQQKSLTTPRSKLSVKMGADPEFEIVQKGRIIPANAIKSLDSTSNQIGCDGSGNQLELRPKPGTPTQVVHNIYKLLKKFKTEHPGLELFADGNRFPCGGHIHFGGVPTKPSRALLELLDDFIGKPSLKLSGTARGNYAELGAWESKPWGFEYRTPPAAIFATPMIATIILKLSKNLVKALEKHATITYNSTPTETDYIKVGGLTKLETEHLLETFNAETIKKLPLHVAWSASATSKPAAPTPKVMFRDDWAEPNKNRFETLSHLLNKNAPNVVLYGLSANRGDVSTIPLPELNTIKHKNSEENPEDGCVWIGLPWKIRMEELDNNTFNTIAKAILKYVKGVKI